MTIGGRLKAKGQLDLVEPELRAEVADEEVEALSVRQEKRQVIEAALMNLTFEHRSVITLTYFHELTLDEISEITGDRIGTLKSRLHYARPKWISKMMVEMAACLALLAGVVVREQRSESKMVALATYAYETLAAEPFIDDELDIDF